MNRSKLHYTLVEMLVALGVSSFVIVGFASIFRNSVTILNDMQAEISLLSDSITLRKKLTRGIGDMPGFAELTKESCIVGGDSISVSAFAAEFVAGSDNVNFVPVQSEFKFDNDILYSSGGADSDLSPINFSFEKVTRSPAVVVNTFGSADVDVLTVQYMMSRTIGSSKYFNVNQIEVPLQ